MPLSENLVATRPHNGTLLGGSGAVLPDTPSWSPARHATIWYSLIVGAALTLLGALGSAWSMSDAIATIIINAGTTVILSATGLHLGGASMERVGAWWLGKSTPQKEATK